MLLNPRVDFAFKKLFGSEENKDCLISLINSIVSEKDRVADVILLNPYNSKEYHDDTYSTLDIKAKDEKGQKVFKQWLARYYKEGMPVNDIATVTGLDMEAIHVLKNQSI